MQLVWKGGAVGLLASRLEPGVGFWASLLQHSSKIKTDVRLNYTVVQIFILNSLVVCQFYVDRVHS